MPYESGPYWIAYYQDNTQTDQRQGYTYADIRRDQLVAFGLYRETEQPIVLVDFRPDDDDPDIGPKRLVWRRRSLKNSQGLAVTIHLIGWQRKVAGRNVQAICYVNEDSTVALGGQWNKEYPLISKTPPLECEADWDN